MMSACTYREGRSPTSRSRTDRNRISFRRGFLLMPCVGLPAIWPVATGPEPVSLPASSGRSVRDRLPGIAISVAEAVSDGGVGDPASVDV